MWALHAWHELKFFFDWIGNSFEMILNICNASTLLLSSVNDLRNRFDRNEWKIVWSTIAFYTSFRDGKGSLCVCASFSLDISWNHKNVCIFEERHSTKTKSKGKKHEINVSQQFYPASIFIRWKYIVLCACVYVSFMWRTEMAEHLFSLKIHIQQTSHVRT